MAKNEGKRFEEDFKKSCPDYALVYRLPDSAQSFGGGGKLRFSRKNPFDFILWDSSRSKLYALELKTVSGKSISFERNEDEKGGEIHYHQIQGLNEWNNFNVVCGFLIFFREIETTIFLSIDSFNKLLEVIQKKSFTVSDLETNNIYYERISQSLARTRYRFDIDSFLSK
jgi:recombination protein U